jgi:uncharacterized protein (TIGR03085 family)
MTSFARAERAALADLLDTVGPAAPTLCTGWDAYDLAAHLVMRERRPDAAAGIVLSPLGGWSEKVRLGLKDKHPFAELVGLVRSGPPRLSLWSLPGFDEATNTGEYFIHHEDVRRAQATWAPRELPDGLETALWTKLRSTAGMAVRKAPSGIVLETPDGRTISARPGSRSVTVRGRPSELTLFCAGRQGAAVVEASGDPELVEALTSAQFGF